jgi:3-keto-5-aminohexanoate cleavage enzyme
MTDPIIISVAPNGSHKTKNDHPNLPLQPEELALEAANCRDAGATLIHLHVRNEKNSHTIGVPYYREAIAAIRKSVGDDIIIQATSEAVGMYSPEEQMDMVRLLKPEAVSLAIKEIIPDESFETKAGDFLREILKNKISPQYVLYSAEDLRRFNRLKASGVIPGNKQFVLCVLGRYSAGQVSSPEDITPFMDVYKQQRLQNSVHWAVCAFGKSEADCMMAATKLGGHVRIGFENNMYLADGKLAENNAALIQQFSTLASVAKRDVATIEQARSLLMSDSYLS